MALDKTGCRILGGNITIVKPPHSQPWVIGIAYNYEDRIECGGTLITKRHVISTAHCEVDSITFCGTSSRCVGATNVVVGEHDQRIEDGQQKLQIEKKHMHPEYHRFDNNDPDMIIYELKEDINNKFAKPANLPKENQGFGLYTVSGWGSMNKARDKSDVLRSVELADIGSDSSCFQIDFFTPSKYICGENQKNIGLGPCGGDSGGTLIHKDLSLHMCDCIILLIIDLFTIIDILS